VSRSAHLTRAIVGETVTFAYFSNIRADRPRVATFRYDKPSPNGKPNDVLTTVRSGLLKVLVQIVREGGESNLHYHTSSETAWLVLRGKARFYGVGDALLGELGPQEGIFLPGGARYWFEKVGTEDLEILQMVGLERCGAKRINVDAHKDWMTDSHLQVY
jgi:mannose-6-phosphate isomerase-like protein (cupin superfamily)